jgi:hypothetical protein
MDLVGGHTPSQSRKFRDTPSSRSRSVSSR